LIVREDLRDIRRVIELDKVENLLLLMPSRIMAPLSMPNLARELEVAHTTVKNWLEQLKRLYILFPVSSWTKKLSRDSTKKRNGTSLTGTMHRKERQGLKIWWQLICFEPALQ